MQEEECVRSGSLWLGREEEGEMSRMRVAEEGDIGLRCYPEVLPECRHFGQVMYVESTHRDDEERILRSKEDRSGYAKAYRAGLSFGGPKFPRSRLYLQENKYMVGEKVLRFSNLVHIGPAILISD